LHQYSFAKKLQSKTVIREKLFKTLLHKKAARKMLVKSILCVVSKWVCVRIAESLLRMGKKGTGLSSSTITMVHAKAVKKKKLCFYVS
jgi:hypothetical protein